MIRFVSKRLEGASTVAAASSRIFLTKPYSRHIDFPGEDPVCEQAPGRRFYGSCGFQPHFPDQALFSAHRLPWRIMRLLSSAHPKDRYIP
jgi:hypothetical protein